MPKKRMGAPQKSRQDNLRQILQNQRLKLRSALHAEMAERMGEEHSSQFENALDSGDLSFVDLLESVEIKLVDIKQKQLAMMVEAERKLDEGTYGVCEICGKEISAARLAARPFAIHCVNCAERVEEEKVRGKGPTL